MGRWWFKHDYHAKNDSKLREIEIEFGMHESYSIWFRMLETMGECGGFLVRSKLPVYAKMIGIEAELLTRFIDHCIGISLLIETEEMIYSVRFLADYRASAEKSAKNSQNASKRWENERNANADAKAEQPHKPDKPKPKTKESSPEIIQLRQYTDAIFRDFPSSKTAKNTLTDDEYQRLLDKFGYDKLVVMQRVYFEWKAGLTTKPKHTDYGTLIKVDGWPSKRADELGCTPKTETVQNQQIWTLPFEKPDGWDGWTPEQRKKYIQERMQK